MTEDIAVEVAQGEADVGLRVAEFDASLFELLREAIEIVVVDVQLMFVVVGIVRRRWVEGELVVVEQARVRRRGRRLLSRVKMIVMIGRRRRKKLMIGHVGLMVMITGWLIVSRRIR